MPSKRAALTRRRARWGTLLVLTTLVSAASAAACSSFSEADPDPEAERTPEPTAETGTTTPEGGGETDAAPPALLDATTSDAAVPCFLLQDEFARLNAVTPPWVGSSVKGGASLASTAAEGGVLIANVPGATNLSASLVGPTTTGSCSAPTRISLRFRARAKLPPSSDRYFLANELRWPGASGGPSYTLFFRVDGTGGSFVYQEQADGGTRSETAAKCTVDETFRDYGASIDFTKIDAPWSFTCDGQANPVVPKLPSSHVSRAFQLQAGISYTELMLPTWIELQSVRLEALP